MVIVLLTQSKTTNNTINFLKVSLSTHKITKGVEMPHWKELILFIPSDIKTFSATDFFRFDLQFLGQTVDYGELPHNSQTNPNLLCVLCSKWLMTYLFAKVWKTALIEIAETKKKSLSYFVDSKGATVEGQVLKCIRSVNCSYCWPLLVLLAMANKTFNRDFWIQNGLWFCWK